jgi:hypothetical protein
MSRINTSLWVVGLIAVAAVVFAVSGTGVSTPAFAAGSDGVAEACDSQSDAKVGSCATANADATCAGKAKSCPGSTGSACKTSSGKCPHGCASACGAKRAKTASLEDIPYREGRRMVLTGHYVCGKCTLNLSESCQEAFRTEDGKNYLLVKNNLSKTLREAALDENVEIVTTVRKSGGVKYLEVHVIRPLA